MTVTKDAVLPSPEDSAAMAAISADLHGERPRLTLVRNGEQTDLPEAAVAIMARVADILASGRGVAVVPVDTELTTREAAELLGVSRPTLIKLLDAGEIGYSRPNSSRRIRLDEVLAYKERRSHRRREALAEMTADAVDAGLYGRPADGAA